MKNIICTMKKKNLVGVLNCLALLMTIIGAQTFCYWFYHQPELPAEADKYRKFK